MKRRKYTAILVHFYITWISVEFIDRTLGVTMCDDGGFDQGNTLSLNISLGNLSTYVGNCTCTVYVVNTRNNVTLTSDITLTPCGSMSLVSSHWDYTSTCPNDGPFNQTRLLNFTQATIFLDVSKPTDQNQVSGSLVLASHLGALSIKCDGAVFDIPEPTTPPPTTTPTTTIRTTTPETPVAGTVTAAVAIVFGGFVILMLLIALGIRHREKKKREHDAYLANIRQVIPDIEREKIDPEMVRYSWFKTLTVRLRRFYFGEARRGRSRHGHGARGRDKSREDEGPTGTQTRRKFQRLFRKKTESTSSSSANRDNSPIEDEYSSTGNDDKENSDKEEVFTTISAIHGGGIFMDARRTSLDNLDDIATDREDTNNVVTVHSEDDTPMDSPRIDAYKDTNTTTEEELVSSLFHDFDENEDRKKSKTSSVIDEEEIKEDGHYIAIGSVSEDYNNEILPKEEDEAFNMPDVDDTYETVPFPQTSHVIGDNDVIGDSGYLHPTTEDKHESNLNKDVDNPEEEIAVVSHGFEPEISSVIENGHANIVGQTDTNEVSKLSNGHPPDQDLYASVDKSKKTKNPLPLFRL